MLSCKDKKIRKSRKSCFLESCRYAILRRVWQALALSSDSQIYNIFFYNVHILCCTFQLLYCITFTFHDINNPWPCALTLSAPCLVDLHDITLFTLQYISVPSKSLVSGEFSFLILNHFNFTFASKKDEKIYFDLGSFLF